MGPYFKASHRQCGAAIPEYLVLLGFFILIMLSGVVALGDASATGLCAYLVTGDIDGDGVVTQDDAAQIITNRGSIQNPTPMDGDLNCDRVIDIADLNIWYERYGSLIEFF